MTDQIDVIRAEASRVIHAMVTRKRRHVAQAVALGLLLGYAAGVWTALGVQ